MHSPCKPAKPAATKRYNWLSQCQQLEKQLLNRANLTETEKLKLCKHYPITYPHCQPSCSSDVSSNQSKQRNYPLTSHAEIYSTQMPLNGMTHYCPLLASCWTWHQHSSCEQWVTQGYTRVTAEVKACVISQNDILRLTTHHNLFQKYTTATAVV